MKYKKARDMLEQICERYVAHNESQLNALPEISYALIHGDFSFNTVYPRSGFCGWVAYEYVGLFNCIRGLRMPVSNADQDAYTDCISKHAFFPFEGRTVNPHYFNERNYVAPSLFIDRLNALYQLMQQTMININKESDFNQKFEEYKSKNEINDLYPECDKPSVQAYKALINLKALIGFVNTLPQYHSKGIRSVAHYFNRLLPTFEGYIKGIAVQELQNVLNDATLNDEEAVKLFASQLENPSTVEILEKTRQSQIEHLLKVFSVALIAVGIGVIPTLFLAAKRLYNTGGTSINFFKPLSKNLCEDSNVIASDINQSHY
ncbi:MAG: hypothetical protein JJT82_08410 [Legionellaceae bacterium]|nr:hypothetical protein [Legionellaceae bacterium]